MLLAPGGHLPKDWPKRFAMMGQRVFDARRDLRVDLAVDDVVSFQFAKLLGEHFFGGPGEKSLQFAEAPDSGLQVVENRWFPLSADNVRSECNGAVRRGHDGVTLQVLGYKKVPTSKKDPLA